MSTRATNIENSTESENIYAEGCAWIEGEYLPIAEARIPITDTGFTRSDCTYDVVATWKKRFFRLEDHLARFERSWQAMHLRPPLSLAEMRKILHECVRRSRLEDAYVEMILTRGVPPAGVRDPRQFQNRFYAFAIPYVWIVQPADQLVGTHLIVAREVTRIEPSSVDPAVKNFHWGDMTRGLYEAYEREAATVVLLNAAGEVTEGPGFNIFVLKDSVLWTPASGVLEGITRKTVLELAAQDGIETRVTMFDPAVLYDADEIFLTSTAGGVMPVTSLDGKPVADGKPGETSIRLRQLYWAAHEDEAFTEAIDD
ncbi:MAG: aminotransferase class IV [Gammaproteobacteria bacterium]|nr:aminotransferase class IV [Gammaproteobacteria bacterium]